MAQTTDLASRSLVSDESLERSAREIRQDIAAKRESISETVDRLGERIHETLDWRAYVAEYPFVALGAAAGVGLLAARLFKPRPTPRERIIEAISETVEDFTDRVRGNLDDVIRKKNASPATALKASVTAMAGSYIMNLLKNKATEMLSARPATGEVTAGKRTESMSEPIGSETNTQATRSSTASSVRS